MDIGTLSKRYAKALYLFATEQGEEERVYKCVEAVNRVYMQVNELPKALTNPMLDTPTKVNLLKEAAGEMAHPMFDRFVQLVFEKHREHLILFMLHSFMDMYRKEKNIYVGKVVTAVPLTEETEKRIHALLVKVTGGDVELEKQVKPGIQGGFVLQVDSLQLDASVAGQLQRIRRKFGELNSGRAS